MQVNIFYGSLRGFLSSFLVEKNEAKLKFLVGLSSKFIFFLKCLIFNLTFVFDANNDHEADNVGGASSIRHEDS